MFTEESGFKSRLSTSKSEFSTNDFLDSSNKLKKASTFFYPNKGPYEVKTVDEYEAKPISRKKASQTVVHLKPKSEASKIEVNDSNDLKLSSAKELSPRPSQLHNLGIRRSSYIDVTKSSRREFDFSNEELSKAKGHPDPQGEYQNRKEERKKAKLNRLETKLTSSITSQPIMTVDKGKRAEATWEDVFGNFLKEIKLRKTTEERVMETKETSSSIFENPYFTSRPFNHKTDVIHTNPSYVRDFGEFLDGKITIEQFINKNNFPRISEEKKKRKEILMLRLVGYMFKSLNTQENIDDILYETEKMIEGRNTCADRKSGSPFGKSISEEKKRLDQETKKLNNQSKVKKLLDLMRNIIKVKIEKRRNLTIMKKHQEVRNWRFFQTFLDITNEYLMKIQNGDLQNGITDSKYYFMASPRKRVLKECFMLTPNTHVKQLTTKLTDYKKVKKSIKYQLNENVTEFLTSLEESKRNKEVFRKHVLKKTIKRQGDSLGLDVINALNQDHVSLNEIEKEKIHNNKAERMGKPPDVKVRKNRKLLYDQDIKFWDYLLNSKIITKHEEAAEIKLKDFDGTEDYRTPENKLSRKPSRYTLRPTNLDSKRSGFSTSRYENKDSNDFFIIKRNKVESEVNTENTEEEKGNESLISMTEVKMDQLYNESRGLQKRIVSMQRDGFGKKIKQLIKLEDIKDQIFKVIKHKLHSQTVLNKRMMETF